MPLPARRLADTRLYPKNGMNDTSQRRMTQSCIRITTSPQVSAVTLHCQQDKKSYGKMTSEALEQMNFWHGKYESWHHYQHASAGRLVVKRLCCLLYSQQFRQCCPSALVWLCSNTFHWLHSKLQEFLKVVDCLDYSDLQNSYSCRVPDGGKSQISSFCHFSCSLTSVTQTQMHDWFVQGRTHHRNRYRLGRRNNLLERLWRFNLFLQFFDPLNCAGPEPILICFLLVCRAS